MIKLNIIGTIMGTTGYDSHTRSLANALYKVTDCRLSTQAPPGWEKTVNDAELDMITKNPEGRELDTNLIITTPNNWKMFTGLGINLGYCVWEGDKVPESWVDEFMNPDINFIIVPSEHTKDAILNTIKDLDCYKDFITYDKIKVIPHGVDREIFNSQQPEVLACQGEGEISGKTPIEESGTSSQYPSADTFKFICNKGWRGTTWDRGGVQYVIKAFAEEFSKKDKVELIIKLNPAYIDPNFISQAIDQLNLSKDRPEIQINCSNLPFNKLKYLYQSADCFVCATRAEAFNLPGLEAMSCGLPTIQTNYGGQTDYMTDKNSLFVDYDLEEVKEDLMYEEISWAVPKIESLRKQMRWAFDNRSDIKQMGKQAEEDSKKWSWDNSASKFLELLKK